MGHIPPNTVGSKSPMAKSSIFLSPAAVRITVPFRKHWLWFWPFWPGFWPGPWPGLGLVCPADGLVVVKLAKTADTPITPIFTRLRRDLRIPVGAFSRAVMFALGTVSLENLQPYYISDRVGQLNSCY